MLNNFTVVLPGGCNAKCAFCPDSMEGKPPADWLMLLSGAVHRRPSGWTDCSITGGEPTISPYLELALPIISQSFSKTVLTTNGIMLHDKVHVIGQYVDFLNISRHGVGAEVNQKAFKTKRVPTDQRLAESIAIFKGIYGGMVNLNHVYLRGDTHIDKVYLEDYVEYAKLLGADSVSFRYDQTENCLDTTELERAFLEYEVIESGSCPVCRSHTVIVNDLPVTFKASFQEPGLAYEGGLYELIFGTNGKLTKDWGGEHEYY